MSKRWFWRTLFGYTVTFMGVDRTYTVVHRPFRQPSMYSVKRNPSEMRGKSYDITVYDEYVDKPPKHSTSNNITNTN